MFKKMFGAVAALTFLFGLASQAPDVTARATNTCSYICCAHNGAGWDN